MNKIELRVEERELRSSLRRFQPLTSVAFGATDGRALRCSLSVQQMLAFEPGSRVLCRTLAFEKGRLPYSGSATMVPHP